MNETLTVLQSFVQAVLDLLIFSVALLDALPGYMRALLTAGLLVWLLARLEREIKEHETRFAELFRKSAFLALAAIPLIVLLFPGIRMVVYADVLPAIEAPTHWVWLGILAVWALGTLISAARLLLVHRRARVEQTALATLHVDAKLHRRLQHWQRRLGKEQPIRLCLSSTQRPWHSQIGRPLIGLPNAAEHWPAPIQDLLLLHELCHYQKNSPRWHLASQLISCAYWPWPWVRSLQVKLDASLQLSADELSEACYRDHMGYARGLRQIDQRLALPTPSTPPMAALRRYFEGLKALAQPEALPHWDITALLSRREQLKVSERHSDPYDRVLVLVGQAVFLAVVLTGTTLRETPPPVDPDQEYVQHYRLIENFHRSLEEFDAKRDPAAGETTANVSEPVALPKSSS